MSVDTLDLPLVIEPDMLADVLGHPNLLILDLSQPQSYTQGHVPGAVFLPFQQLMAGGKPAPGLLPSAEKLTALFSALGLTDQTHVVAYDDEGGGWAGRLIWTLDMIGHTQYSYLDGGIHAWVAENKPLQTETVEPVPSEYAATVVGDMSVNKAYILANLANPKMVIWDARSMEEHIGTKVNAIKGGHIPGAKSYEWTRAMDKANHLRIRDHKELLDELGSLGIVESKTVVTHCQSHHRSGFTYLLGKVLGFPDIKAYPGSWGEWGNAAETPVKTELNQ